MISSGERVAVAVSGGKDSLSLLRLLDVRRKTAREAYDLVAIHLVGDARGPETPAHPPLMDWLLASGYESTIIPLEVSRDESLPMDCQRCTWNRRKLIFQEARRLGCSVVCFGHHADDLAQTTLLNLLFHGKVETMAPVRSYFGGTLRLVRPLCFTQEREIARFARVSDFPPPPPDCPRANTSHRRMVKELIRMVESRCQDTRVNLLRAGLRGNEPIHG